MSENAPRHTVSIKFCGGCNPKIDRRKVANQVQEQLEPLGYEIVFNTVKADFIIYLSGCTINCAHKHTAYPPLGVVVGGETIDGWAVPEAELAHQIVNRVREYCERLERNL